MALTKPGLRTEFFSDVKQAVKELSQGYADEDYTKLENEVKWLRAERERLLNHNTKLIRDNEEMRHRLQPMQTSKMEEIPHSEDFTVEALLSENNALRDKLDVLTMQLRNSVVGKDENFQYNNEVHSQVYKTDKQGVLLISQEYLEALLCKV